MFFLNFKHTFEVIVLVSNIGLTNYICDNVLTPKLKACVKMYYSIVL